MKELSIEQKAKAYDKALERARNLHKDAIDMGDNSRAKQCEIIFPELRESKDDRIMRVIRGWIYTRPASFFDNGISKEEILAWLEKQGEKDVRRKFLEDLLVADDIYQMSMNEAMVEEARTKAINALSELEISKLLGIEKQGEQKPVDSYCQENCKGFQETGKCFADGDCKAKREAESNDKNEPKFHEGDWVVSGQFVTQIREIAGDGYVNSHNGFISFEGAKYYHIWTIQDAKDGDVLAMSAGAFIYNGNNGGGSCPGSYCGINTLGNFKVGVEHHWTGRPVFPATKEQRDTLFAKMKEAGCMFDFEKKELKKLGQPEVTKTSDQEEIAEIPFGAKDSELQEATYYIPKGFYAEIKGDIVLIKKGKQKPEWSEEDERNIQNIDSVLFYDKKLPEDTCVKLRNFLKTLKERIEG